MSNSNSLTSHTSSDTKEPRSPYFTGIHLICSGSICHSVPIQCSPHQGQTHAPQQGLRLSPAFYYCGEKPLGRRTPSQMLYRLIYQRTVTYIQLKLVFLVLVFGSVLNIHIFIESSCTHTDPRSLCFVNRRHLSCSRSCRLSSPLCPLTARLLRWSLPKAPSGKQTHNLRHKLKETTVKKKVLLAQMA